MCAEVKEVVVIGLLVRKIVEIGLRRGKKIQEIDPASPITADTLQFVLDVAKEIVKPF